jgi:excisionase family DNA binding protein
VSTIERTERTVTPDYVSVREVATLYNVGKDCVYAAIKRGELPAVRFGGVLRVPLAALREIKLLRVEEE